jgi:outer membrane protein assembly factor BamB
MANLEQDVEQLLRKHVYNDSRPDFEKFWNTYIMRRDQKEAFMSENEKRGTGKIIAWLVGFVVIVAVGWFGLTKFADIKKAEKIEKGEAIVVTLIVGDASVKKMGSTEWRKLYVEDNLQMGDAVKTAKDSYCELQMVKRGIFRVESGSELYLAKLVNDNDKVNSRMKLSQGGMTLKPSKLKEGENFEVETSTAVAAVRGTKFSVNIASNGNTQIAVDEGKVAVKPNIKSFEKAKDEGKMDQKSSEVLEKQIVQSIDVTPGQQANLETTKVEALNKAISTAIEKVAEKQGPITSDKVTKTETNAATAQTEQIAVANVVSKEIVATVNKDTTVSGNGKKESDTLVSAVVEKEKISIEAKKQLDNLSADKLINDVKDLVKVKIESRPNGASVFINDVKMGVTPLEQIYEKGKKINVKILKEGYNDFAKDLEINPGTSLNAELAQLQAETVAPGKVPGELEWEKPMSAAGNMDKEPVFLKGRIFTTIYNKLMIFSTEGKLLKAVTVVEEGFKLTRPVTGDGIIYVGSDNGGIFAYSVNGEQIWKADAGSEKYGASPAANFGIVAVPSIEKGIKIYSKSGELRDTIEVSAPIYAAPLILDDGQTVIYATESGDIVAYDTTTKTKRWTKSYNERFVYPLVGEKTVITLIRKNGKVMGINPVDGAVVWSNEFPEIAKTKLNPQYDNGKVILANNSEKSIVIVLNALNGAVYARVSIPEVIGVPYVVGNTIVMGTTSGKVYSYNMYLKKTDWTLKTASKTISMVVGDNNGIYAVSPTAMYKINK